MSEEIELDPMKAVAVEMHRCPNCYKLHAEYDDAFDCCEKEIGTAWACSLCDEEFLTEQRAKKHIAECFVDPCCVYQIERIELEAAGQLSMIDDLEPQLVS